MTRNKDKVQKELKHVKAGMQELEGLVTRRSLNTVAENTAPDSLFNSRRESGIREDAFGPFDQDTKPEPRVVEGKPGGRMISTLHINKEAPQAALKLERL